MGIMDKAKDVLSTDKGEEKTDQLLDQAEQKATDKFGEDKGGVIGKAREVADDKIGAPNDAPAPEGDQQ